MHYFGNPRHTQSIITYIMILTEYFWEFQFKIVLWDNIRNRHIQLDPDGQG